MMGASTAMMEAGMQGIADWWRRVNASTAWQEHIFLGLAIAYAVIALVVLVSHLYPHYEHHHRYDAAHDQHDHHQYSS